jgi:hypothetical protein
MQRAVEYIVTSRQRQKRRKRDKCAVYVGLEDKSHEDKSEMDAITYIERI